MLTGFRRRAASPAAFLVALASVTGCGPKALDRAEALSVLSRDTTLVRTRFLPVPNRVYGDCAGVPPVATGAVKLLLTEGKMTLQQRGGWCFFLLAPAGRRDSAAGQWHSREVPQLFGPTRYFWDVPAARSVVRHVDGVAQAEHDANTATVQYTIGSELLDFGKAVANAPDGKVPTDTVRGEAELRRFDDGWRVVKLGGVR